VANVYFEALETDTAAGVYKDDIVLYLDSLKVSTIETTAEDTAAQGGWGNPRLVVWDFNKEINITLEDALISFESLRFMVGGAIHKPKTKEPVIVRHSEEVVCTAGGIVPKPKEHLSLVEMTPKATVNHPIRLINLTKGTRTQLVAASASDTSKVIDGTTAIDFKNSALIDNAATSAPTTSVTTAEGDHIRIFWDEILVGDNAETESAVEVTISPNTLEYAW